MFQKFGTYQAHKIYGITHNVLLLWKPKTVANLGPPNVSVALRHAAGDTLRSALEMGRRKESAVYSVGIAVVAPGTSSSVGRVLGNRDVERRSIIMRPFFSFRQ